KALGFPWNCSTIRTSLNNIYTSDISNVNQYERIGSDVTMQCGSLDNDASVSWKVNGTDVKAQHRLEGPRLTLNEVDLGHNGLYSCFQNPHGERQDVTSIRLFFLAGLSLC
uniref:Ig-like domain-containing protein n=1 Tax=Labrus bergylta TaxID=56723 RepID=A0A3Q3G873_9LABR